jgi:outer membrane immunogenic protein
LKKLLAVSFALAALAATAPVSAADLPNKMYSKAPLMAAPGTNWTGCYVGANGGYGWGKDDVAADGSPFGAEGSPNFKGGLGGGQLGCDYQFAPSWVVGVEAMYDFASLKGDVVDPANTAAITASKYSGIGAVAGRVGYAFDRSLLYVIGGLGVSRSERTLVGPGFSQSTSTRSKTGWMIGGGWEYMFAQNWSAKIEYNHYDFGKFSESVTQLPSGSVFLQNDRNTGVDVVLVGVNFRFH